MQWELAMQLLNNRPNAGGKTKGKYLTAVRENFVGNYLA